MKKASITQTKNQLSALIDVVKQGETVLILNRGRPVARLEPLASAKDAEPDDWLAELEREGLARRPKRPPLSIRELGKPVKLPKGISAVRALLDEREEGW